MTRPAASRSTVNLLQLGLTYTMGQGIFTYMKTHQNSNQNVGKCTSPMDGIG